MYKVTLVLSAHRESGLCNAEELLKILGGIGPEVIFEEIRPSDFDDYCKQGASWSLEAKAIARYCGIRTALRIPVDQFYCPASCLSELKREFDFVLDFVEQASREYQLLIRAVDDAVYQRGFVYLNSGAYSSAREQMSEIESDVIRKAGHHRLISSLDKWREFNQRRERAMVQSILKHCENHTFETSVFLVGAAHLMGVNREIRAKRDVEVDFIQWKQN